MNTIRVWTLRYASQESIDNFIKVLQSLVPGEDCDIVWNEELTVQELKGDGHVDIVTGPGIMVTRDGSVVKVEKEEES